MIRFFVIFFILTGISADSLCRANDSREEDLLTSVIQAPLEAAGDVFSAATNPFFDLGSIRLGGGRIESAAESVSLMKSTRSVEYFSSWEMDEKTYSSTAEFLSQASGVTYSDDLGQGLNGRVDLRGFGGEAKQALVLMDGLRVVEPFDNSVSWHLYPLEYLENVEVMPGGASPIYGEGALSGVVSLKTKEPSKKWQIKTENALGSYGLRKYFVEAGGELSAGLGIWAGARYLETDGYRQNSSHESGSTFLKAKYEITDLLVMSNSFYFADNETGIPGPLTPSEARANRRQKDPDGQFGDNFNDRLAQNGLRLDYQAEPIGVEVNNLTGYRLRNQGSVQSFGGAFPGTSLNDIDTESFSNVLQAARSWERGGLKDSFLAGFEWSIDDIYNPFRFEDKTFGPFESERAIDRRLWGLFVQNRVEIPKNVAVETGFRFDRIDWDIYDLKAPSLEKHKKSDSLSPQISLSWSPDERFTLFGGYSESFKAPDSNTLIFETPNIFSPNPNIDSSIAKHSEIGFRAVPTGSIFVKSAYFHIQTEKEILFNDIRNLNENFDTLREGVEISSEWKPDKTWSFFINYTYTDSAFKQGAFDEKRIPMVAQTKWASGVSWKGIHGWGAVFQARGDGGRFALNDFNNIFPAEDYWTADLKIKKSFSRGEVYLTAQNLFNEKYSSFVTSNGVDTINLNPAPGLNVEAGVRLQFD